MRVAFLKVGEYEGTLRHFKAFAGRFRERGAEVLELDIGQGDLNVSNLVYFKSASNWSLFN